MSVPKALSTVPFRSDPDFSDFGLLDQIEEKCKTALAWIALVGFGGVGKSQLAIECFNAARFEQSFWEIAERAKIPGREDPTANIFEMVHDWLQEQTDGQWVLILDHVDNDHFLQEIPANRNGGRERPLNAYIPLGHMVQ
ncbi:hypothetical protein BJX70DRAFT_403594 [Aspergillus crustosus]